MKQRIIPVLLALLLLLAACAGPSPETSPVCVPETTQPTLSSTESTPELSSQEPAPEDFVRVLDYIPNARQALPYATEQNFTGQKIYTFTDAYLRYGTVKKLSAVSEDLAELGLYLLIWDGFRPVSAQYRLWEICPDPAYVADPTKGFSSHSRGNTVDITLVDAQGDELEMPTAFDDFSARADRNYSDCAETAAAHAQILEIIMEKHGFAGYSQEWWHFSDTDEYPVEEQFCPPDA